MNADQPKRQPESIAPEPSDDSLSAPPGKFSIPDHWHDEEKETVDVEASKVLDEPQPVEEPTSIDETALYEFEEEIDIPSEEKQSLEDILSPSIVDSEQEETEGLQREVAQLKRQKQALQTEIRDLQRQKAQLICQQTTEIQEAIKKMVKEGLKELEQNKQSLEIAIEQLERRRERIRQEMRTTFAGVSQELAIRVQGFKEYLVGSLQDLAACAEQLELPSVNEWKQAQPEPEIAPAGAPTPSPQPQFTQPGFQEQARRIRELLEQYRTRPDYYGPAWQLRRTFEPIHAERVQKWFFSQGGRGTIRSMGSRLQNILVSSAIISVLSSIYGDRVRVLVLANSPERLGEWRRGLQDCLGISRSDFGPDRGVVLFESPEALIQKADRLVEERQLPFVILDETEDRVNLSLLQFPLWLAFAPDPQQMSSYLY